MKTIQVQRTIIIGNGTSSGEIISRTMSLINESHGKIPVIRYLWIDIDSKIPAEAKPWFSPNERVELSGFDPAEVIQNIENHPTIKAWWPQSDVPAGYLSGGGGSPKQMRPIGRLALFLKYNDRTYGPSFIDKLKAAINSLSEIKKINDSETMSNDEIQYVVEDGFRIYIIASPCGGTGSSMAFDIAYLCRQYLQGKNPTITYIGMMPSVIEKAIKSETHFQREKICANAAAFFKEDYYLIEHPLWNVTYPEDGPVIIAAPPFDYRYIIEIENQAGYRLDSVEDIYNMIAQALYTDIISSIAGDMREFLKNVSVFDEKFNGMRRAYSSLAAASIVLPKDRLKLYCGSRFAEEMINKGFLTEPKQEDVEVSVSTVLSQQGLRDADLISSLMDQIGSKMQYASSIQKSDTVALALSQIDTQEGLNQKMRESEAAKIKETAADILEQAKENLNRELTHLVVTKGARYVQNMVDTLLAETPHGLIDVQVNNFDGLAARINQQGSSESDLDTVKKELGNLRKSLATLDDGVEDKLERLVDKKGWNKKFGVHKNKCVNAMQEINDLYYQIKAQQQAIQIYDQLREWLGNYKTGLNSIEVTLKRLAEKHQHSAQRIANKKETKTQTFEFLQEIEVDFEEFYQDRSKNLNAAQSFSSMIPAGKSQDIHQLVSWVDEKLGSVSVQFAQMFFEKHLENASILDMMEEIALKKNIEPQTYIKERVNSVIRYCHPFWRYNKNLGLQGMEGKSMIGVEWSEHPLIPEEFRSSPQFVVKTTGFRDRIDIVRVQHGLPAFMLGDMAKYKRIYDQRLKERAGNDPLHVLPGMELADEIIPEQGKKNRELFALALAFDYIVQSGSWYYYDPDRKYKTHKISPSNETRLAQGRENAEDAFVRQDGWSREVEEKIENEIRQIGNETAIEKLEKTVQEYYQMISKLGTGDTRRKQFEKEVRALQLKQRQLGKIN